MSNQIVQSKKRVYCPNCKAEIGFKQHHCPKYQAKNQENQKQEPEAEVKELLYEIIQKLDKLLEERK